LRIKLPIASESFALLCQQPVTKCSPLVFSLLFLPSDNWKLVFVSQGEATGFSHLADKPQPQTVRAGLAYSTDSSANHTDKLSFLMTLSLIPVRHSAESACILYVTEK
jgi:hypothetical protein